MRSWGRAFVLVWPLCAASACVSIPEPAGTGMVEEGCEDGDGDGYRPEGCDDRVPPDCEEGEADVHPGAFEICGNDIDEDCLDGDLPCQESIQPVSEFSATGLLVGRTQVDTASGAVVFDADEGFSITSLISNKFAVENAVHVGMSLERYVGSHMFPSVFSYESTLNSVERQAAGRAAYRYEVTWTAGDDPNQQLAGRTTYSIFPDGRIHRSESLEPTGTAQVFATYLALDPGLFTHRLDPTNLDNPIPLVTEEDVLAESLIQPLVAGNIDTSSTFVGRSCAYSDVTGRALSYAWNAYQTEPGFRVRMPQSALGGTAESHQFAMVLDWQTSSPAEAVYRGAFQILLGQTAATGALCGGFDADVSGFLAPPQITRRTDDVAALGDFNDDGFVEDGGFYEVNIRGGISYSIEFTDGGGGTRPDGYSVHVLEPPNSTDPIVYVPDGESVVRLSHGRDYLLHHEQDGSLWLFVNRPIEPGIPVGISFPVVP